MQLWTVMSCVLSATILASRADPLSVSSSPENKSPHPDPAVLVNGGKRVVREGSMLSLHDHMKQGDAFLKERLKESISNLKELLQEEDAHLNERISEGLARLKEQLKEGDGQLKEELVEEVAGLKEKLAKGLSYLKEELVEEGVTTKEEMAKLKEAVEKQQHDVKQSTNAPVEEHMRQQMCDFQTEVMSIKRQLQTTQAEVKTHQEILQSTQDSLQSTRAQLNTAEQEIRSLKVDMESGRSSHDLVLSEMGSTFTRWGRTTCPDNATLVYSGFVGGQPYDHSGGGSNFLCLVRNPQLDNMTLPARYNYVYGAEYQDIDDLDDQDAVCSVCWTPQVTTLMIPATLSCPSGWTVQYRGHLASGNPEHKGRDEYVCLDQDRESRDGGQAHTRGVEFFHVVTQCDPLPCPPYVNNKVVTCVVCSK